MEIRIRNLSKDFFSEGKRIKALSNIDLTIPSNHIFTLLGPSGCGKTTLLRCIVGLETPNSGEIAIGEETVFSSEKEVFVPPEKRGLGMVFQTYAIWPHMNVFDNVAYPLQVRNEPSDTIRTKVAKTLRFVKLEGFENRPATKLSGGQQQRVALARALIAEPKVILFDEPLSNLDAKLREETRKELRSFLTRLRITAVYVTHDQIEALSLSDRMAVMKEGRIVEIGTPRDIYFNSNQGFVADFIGKANLIRGKVANTENRYTTVDSAIGMIACRRTPHLSPGTEVSVCIRPEFIRVLAKEAKEGLNLFHGRVHSLVFAGDACEAEIHIMDIPITTRIEAQAGIEEGDAVSLHLDPLQCVILSG